MFAVAKRQPGDPTTIVELRRDVFAEPPDTSGTNACFDLAEGVKVCVASSTVERRTDDECARQTKLIDAVLAGASKTRPKDRPRAP